jgi:hypothetical protein
MAILITSSVCNFEYCIHVNTCTISACRTYTFELYMFVVYVYGNTSVWNSTPTTNIAKRTSIHYCLINTCKLLYALFVELAGLRVNNFCSL